MGLAVRYSSVAAAKLEELKPKNPDTAAAKTYKMIKQVIEQVIANEDLAFHRRHCLRDNLAGILRVKTGRFRIFFIASSQKRKAIVLHIGFRKEGDRHDAYVDFERLLKRGDFDLLFAELEVTKPKA